MYQTVGVIDDDCGSRLEVYVAEDFIASTSADFAKATVEKTSRRVTAVRLWCSPRRCGSRMLSIIRFIRIVEMLYVVRDCEVWKYKDAECTYTLV